MSSLDRPLWKTGECCRTACRPSSERTMSEVMSMSEGKSMYRRVYIWYQMPQTGQRPRLDELVMYWYLQWLVRLCFHDLCPQSIQIWHDNSMNYHSTSLKIVLFYCNASAWHQSGTRLLSLETPVMDKRHLPVSKLRLTWPWTICLCCLHQDSNRVCSIRKIYVMSRSSKQYL